MAPPGRKENLGETASINVTVPKVLFEYLTELARNSPFGVSVTEVAGYLLKQSVDRLIERRFHTEELPTGDESRD
jgi:hypothetical protein